MTNMPDEPKPNTSSPGGANGANDMPYWFWAILGLCAGLLVGLLVG